MTGYGKRTDARCDARAFDKKVVGALTASEQREFDRLLVKIADASKTGYTSTHFSWIVSRDSRSG